RHALRLRQPVQADLRPRGMRRGRALCPPHRNRLTHELMSNPAPAPTAASAHPPGALVLGGAHGGLAIPRSLRRRGITIDALSDRPLVGLSRYVRRRLAWSDPGRPDALSRLIGLAHQEKLEGATLFAGGDAEVRFVAQNHAALAAIFRLTTPPWRALERAV